MSKYFTKYLKVEGEIKNGDWYYDPISMDHFQAEINSDGVMIGTLLETNTQGVYKVKLFLCSRDIQVGDKFQQEPACNPPYISTCADKRDGFIICDEERKWADNTVFKIIGEVSKNAVWVKEGDELEKGDWDDGVIDNDGKIARIPFPANKSLPDRFKFIVMIKCPTCLTYH